MVGMVNVQLMTVFIIQVFTSFGDTATQIIQLQMRLLTLIYEGAKII